MEKIYDTIIIGGGPGGLSAAIYAARSKMKTLVIEQKRKTGGQAATTYEMENYPGFPSASGPEIMDKFREHCDKFGVEFARGKVERIEQLEDGFLKKVITKDDEFTTKTIIVGTGAEPRVLGIPGENTFRGKGVSYCATCDGDFYEDLDIVVVGNGNTAVEESMYLTKFVNKITMIVIHDEGTMDADKAAQEQIKENCKIEYIWNSTVAAINGDEMVDHVMIKNIKTNEVTKLDCDGVFMFVGTVPRTDFLEGLVDLNPQKYIKINERMETNVPGIFACGDVTNKMLRQVVTAASDGAIAAVVAEKYIEEEENWEKNVLKCGKPALVAFWSPINSASLDAITNLEKLHAGSTDTKLVKIDAYKFQRIANRYGVSDIPTILRIEDGQVKNRITAENMKELEKII
ncbi:MAG: thioredoxin-disulfide reductase [Candidatus Cloacimonadales bacterium]